MFDQIPKEAEKVQFGFNLEREIAKIKISVPFNELLKNAEYRGKISKMLEAEETTDSLNLLDDQPSILFGPHVKANEKIDVPPFYISLNFHDKTLHNAMLDTGASHNLMPKVVMDSLGLDITRPYKDLFSFDSMQVKCLSMIKDLIVTLAQIPAKSVIMDVVVAYMPTKFGMLLSRSWAAKLKGTLQMDISYVTIRVFREMKRLYRETRLAYMVSCKEHPNNHPIYVVDTDLGLSIFFNDMCYEAAG